MVTSACANYDSRKTEQVISGVFYLNAAQYLNA
jgi:hypothetical protein